MPATSHHHVDRAAGSPESRLPSPTALPRGRRPRARPPAEYQSWHLEVSGGRGSSQGPLAPAAPPFRLACPPLNLDRSFPSPTCAHSALSSGPFFPFVLSAPTLFVLSLLLQLPASFDLRLLFFLLLFFRSSFILFRSCSACRLPLPLVFASLVRCFVQFPFPSFWLLFTLFSFLSAHFVVDLLTVAGFLPRRFCSSALRSLLGAGPVLAPCRPCGIRRAQQGRGPAGWILSDAARPARPSTCPRRFCRRCATAASGWDQRSQDNCFSLSPNCGFYQESLFQRAQTRSSAASLISSADPHTPPALPYTFPPPAEQRPELLGHSVEAGEASAGWRRFGRIS